MIGRLKTFWLAPVDALPLGVVRVVFAFLFLAYVVMISPNRYAFFAESGVVSTVMAGGAGSGPQLLRFANAAQVDFVFGLAVFAGGFLLIGLWTRPASWLVWVCLMSFQGRNLLVHNGADVLLRLLAFYLAVSPSGAALSVDCRNKFAAWSSSIPAWPLRLLQLQACAIYGQTVLMKLNGDEWRDGTALHYVLNLTDYQRLPWPHFLDAPLPICVLTWGVLALEFALAVCIWFPRWRRPLLALAVVMHLSIEWMLTISQFAGAMLCLLGSFVTAAEYRAFAWSCCDAWLGRRTLPLDMRRKVMAWPPARRCYDTLQYAFNGELKETGLFVANGTKIKGGRD
jgi:hypothetical protein